MRGRPSALRCRPWPERCAPSGCSTPVPASTCSGTCPRGEPRSSAGSAPCRGSSVRSRRPGSSCCRAGQPSWASGSGWVRPPHCSGSRRTNSSTRWCRWTTCGVTAPSGSASSSPPPRHPPAEAAIGVLQNQLATLRAVATRPDPLVATAVRRLMPWETADIGALTRELDISTSQLRRRFLSVVGVAPKTLQRTLRFQGYLALAQAAAADDGPGGGRLADLAAAVGYADQSHLGRECLRLAGLTPRQLLGGRADSCGLGHDHSASYQPFLAGAQRARDARSVQDLVGRAF